MKKILAILTLTLIPYLAQAQRRPPENSLYDEAVALPWQRGPLSVPVAGSSHIYVPGGYMFLSPPAAEKFLQLNGNPTQGDGDYILSTETFSWFAVFSFKNIGFVRDEKYITKAQQEKTLKDLKDEIKNDNEIRAKNGWPSLTLLGWFIKPKYDYQTKRLEWATVLATTNGQKTINFNTRILGRYGVTNVDLVDDPTQINKDIPTLNELLSNFSYNVGNKYGNHTNNDKIAKYGLLGLIAGGATAAAVKTGFFAAIIAVLGGFTKAIFVFIIAVFAAIVKYIKNIMKRKY